MSVGACRCDHRTICVHAYLSTCGCIRIQRHASLRALLARLLSR